LKAMIYVKIIATGEVRPKRELGHKNWRWLANGDCEVTFDDKAVGIVISEDEADRIKVYNWLKPDENKEPESNEFIEWIERNNGTETDTRTGIDALLDSYKE
jgi:hypothetical protein